MRVLILSNSPIVESQGSGYIIVNTARSLTALGHQVDMIPPDGLNFLPSWRNRARNYRFAIGIAKWVYAHQARVATYDLVIFYGAESALAVYILKRMLQLTMPVILHSNGLEMHVNYRMKDLIETTNELKWYNFDQSWIFKYCYDNVDAIITLSKYERDFAVQSIGIDPKKIYFIEPCLPEVFFDYQPEITVVRKPIIVYCGTWITRKGIQAVKEAIPRLLEQYPEYTLRIIGTGNEFKAADEFPAALLGRIETFPLVESKEEMIRLYSESSIFVFPSVHESFGLVIAEAMFCGCAVVSGQTGFATNVANGTEAIVLDKPDTEHVYAAVKELIDNDSLRESLSHNGHERTLQLQWGNYRRQLDAVLQTVFYRHAVA
jgi:glycosyltransferase involved in cell wall biosynthesis